MNSVNKKIEWTNWARNVKAAPRYAYVPKSIREVQDVVDSCRIRGVSLRVTGAAHSFSPVAQPDNDTLSLENLRGLISYDEEAMEVRLWAGTYLYEAVTFLGRVGMAFENLGNVQEQTIAGAISTGTHGTGLAFGSLSDQVIAWTWVNGKGEVKHHRRGNDDLSKALGLSLGLLGVLVDVTIRTVPLYSLRVESTRQSFSEALTAWSFELKNNRHLEWFYFPGTNTIQVKKANMMPLVKQSLKSIAADVVKNNVIGTATVTVISELCRKKPQLTRQMMALSAKSVPTGKKEGLYYEVLSSQKLVKFTEVEYGLPVEQFETVMQEIHHFLKAHPFFVHIPIACRVTAGEDTFLSPTQGQETVFLAFHMYKGMDNGPYFEWVHNLMAKYGGRPHFGKINNLTYDKVIKVYPNLNRFMEIREQNDPNQVFMSRYLKKLFLND